jgi:hypothetical protein
MDVQFMDIELINTAGFLDLTFRFLLNLVILFVVVRMLYYPTTRRKDYLFTYFLIGITIFLLCYTLGNVKLQIGMALGLFAIFGIIRYRTNPMPIKEMTYLFVVIAISVINALTSKKVSWAELFFANFILIAIIYGLERVWLLRNETFRFVTYDKIDLILPEKRPELIADLELRTGMKIKRVEIGPVNFLRETAKLKIYFMESLSSIGSFEEMSSDSDDDE